MLIRLAPKSPACPAYLVVLASLVMLSDRSAHADVFHVPADYPTIEDAAIAAGDGDEIVIAPGTYAPFNVGAKQGLIIRSSDGPAVTIIDAGGVEACVVNLGSGHKTFQGLTFTNGVGETYNGGAINLQFGSPSFTFTDCVFSYCSSVKGAIGTPSATGGSGYTFTGCTFEGNSGEDAGVLKTLGGSYAFVDCTFSNNSATDNGAGGALTLEGSPLISITGCTFEGNTALRGGAIHNGNDFNAPGDQLDDCVFEGNTATGVDGGGAIWTREDMPITNCTFLNNTAPSGPGGAVRATEPATVVVTGCTFDQNQATDGGAVLLIGGTLTDCNFTGNIASGAGGAVHAASGESTLVNCDMSMNTAGSSGGGIFVVGLAIVNISDSTLCMNTPDQFAYVGAFLATNVFGCDVTCPNTDAMGACCLTGGACVSTTEANCVAAGGTYQGDATTCGRANCAPPPACLADIVDSGTFQPPPDGVVDGADLGYLLGAWGRCR